MSGAEDDLVGHTLIALDKAQTDVGASRRSTLTQRQPPNPYKNKRKIVAVAAIVILGLTVWSCIAAYHVVKHLVWGPDVVLEESSAGAEIHVPAPSPLPLAAIRWTAQHFDSGQEKGKIKDQGRSRAGKSPTIACIVHARRQRLQQVLATSKTWLPTCDAHALISFGDVPKELQSFPHVIISQPGFERCADRIALNISTVLFPTADWVFLASDDSFVMVDRLREWLGGLKPGSYPDLPSDGNKPSLLISRASLRSLNVSECDAGASPSVASLVKQTKKLHPLRPIDSKGRPIVLNKYKTDNQFDLSPQLSIIEKVSAAEMTLLHHIHVQKHD
ncbi:hypothetical protein PRIPAC_87513 [Pristionchus pacificus]|uniref:Uncharacterized protein n=1 Tax=Pristionchus pacificus TaxID=54126 RepID=A0A454Y1L2_PRIPA|nr:hypothetical protein PRIPAC_87513 [Pristionchus pacificus]|eukprot:PDM61978.1 hypothetical protein PRIPAC_51420 [Pristionchus pacificus]